MRILFVVAVVSWCGSAFLCRSVAAILARDRKRISGIAGESLADGCEQLGGAFLKAGQILSARVDLLAPEMVTALSRLRDNTGPLPFGRLRASVLRLMESTETDVALEIASSPLASATIAQVHLGTVLSTGRRLAVKIRRPGIDRLLAADVRYIGLFARLAARLPWFRCFPISEATNEVCAALLRQVDFVAEAKMLASFRQLFSDDPHVAVPEVDESRCSDDVIVMEYLDGYRPIQTFRGQPELAKWAVLNGLRALYKMIFDAGLIHCDLHASNILCNEEGRVALLDFGFVSEMTTTSKRDFAEFFFSIGSRDGKTAARIVQDTALRVGDHFDPVAFEHEMQSLVDKSAGRRAAEFQVAAFVFELFQIQRRHGIYGSPSFTLPILSLLTYEGLIKAISPEIDFQLEAVPFVMAAITPG